MRDRSHRNETGWPSQAKRRGAREIKKHQHDERGRIVGEDLQRQAWVRVVKGSRHHGSGRIVKRLGDSHILVEGRLGT